MLRDDTKVGDELLLIGRSWSLRYYALETVTKRTPTQVHTATRIFNMRGDEVGRGPYGDWSAENLTPEGRALYDAQQQRSRRSGQLGKMRESLSNLGEGIYAASEETIAAAERAIEALCAEGRAADGK